MIISPLIFFLVVFSVYECISSSLQHVWYPELSESLRVPICYFKCQNVTVNFNVLFYISSWNKTCIPEKQSRMFQWHAILNKRHEHIFSDTKTKAGIQLIYVFID